MTTLWEGTQFESFAERVFQCPTHRMAYYLGQVEQTCNEVFGIMPQEESVPDEARQVAHLMLQVITSGNAASDSDKAVAEVTRIIAAWRKRRGSN